MSLAALTVVESHCSVSAGKKKRVDVAIDSRKLFRAFISVVLVAVVASCCSLPLLGHWLVREDPVHSADAIAVLTGSFPQRAIEAAQLYHRGYAPEIWLTHPLGRSYADGAQQAMQQAEDLRNAQVLRSFGVPEEAIHVLETPIVNTADELNAIGDGLKAMGDSSVIIVTNKAHTRRVYSLWEKYHSSDGEMLVHAVSHDQFKPSRWWMNPTSRGQAVHEMLGMLDLWAGLPVHQPLQDKTN